MPDIKVRVGQQNAVKVVYSIAGSKYGTLGNLSDVNASALANGKVLVYNGNTGKGDDTREVTPGATHNLDIKGGRV